MSKPWIVDSGTPSVRADMLRSGAKCRPGRTPMLAMHHSHQAEPPLYARMHNEIAARIADHEWMPGAAIPPERNLAAAYGVSLGTIRRAIELLVTEGRLKRRQGSGTFVRG